MIRWLAAAGTAAGLTRDQMNACFSDEASFIEIENRALSGRSALLDQLSGDALEVEVDDACIHLLALQQPMAGDLRLITMAMKICNDLERVGDHPDRERDRGDPQQTQTLVTPGCVSRWTGRPDARSSIAGGTVRGSPGHRIRA